jgi:hypothetical protein
MKNKIFTIIYLLNPIGLAAQVPGVKMPQFPQPASISPGVVIGLPNPSQPSTGLPFGNDQIQRQNELLIQQDRQRLLQSSRF